MCNKDKGKIKSLLDMCVGGMRGNIQNEYIRIADILTLDEIAL